MILRISSPISEEEARKVAETIFEETHTLPQLSLEMSRIPSDVYEIVEFYMLHMLVEMIGCDESDAERRQDINEVARYTPSLAKKVEQEVFCE